jgi:hypothetical protein
LSFGGQLCPVAVDNGRISTLLSAKWNGAYGLEVPTISREFRPWSRWLAFGISTFACKELLG